MNCKTCQEKMTEWVGEDISNLSEDFLSHLKSCEACSSEWKNFQELTADLKSAENFSVPPDLFWQKQRISIQEKISKNSRFHYLPRWVITFSLGLLLVFVGYQSFLKFKTAQNGDLASWVAEEVEENNNNVDEIIDQMNPEQLQKAIQSMENDSHGRVL